MVDRGNATVVAALQSWQRRSRDKGENVNAECTEVDVATGISGDRTDDVGMDESELWI